VSTSRTGQSSRAGFTLIEVVLAMGLFLLGMTSILGLLSFGAALARAAELRAVAASSVQAVMADLEERLFPLLEDPATGAFLVGEPQPIAERAVTGQIGLVYSAKATAEPAESNGAGRAERSGPRRYRVDVEMRWSAAGRTHVKAFTTLMLGEVPFGERMRRLLVAGEKPEPLGADARPASTEMEP
jgi:hypothetical protein